MKRFPEGISCDQIRHELEREGIPAEDIGHLGRRIRELDKWFIIEKTTITQTAKSTGQAIGDEGQISETLRAEVLYASRGRCQRCGKTIKTDSITLVVDHKKPRDLGGTNDRQNLWAICEECNGRKKAHLVRPRSAGARPRFKCCRMSTIGRQRQHEL
jgi:5-methylcytosine-specific restriction endonuclease McrA